MKTTTIAAGLLVLALVGAGEPMTEECSALGSEGNYYLVQPLPGLDSDMLFDLLEHPSRSGTLVGHLIMPPLPGRPPSEIRQISFDRVTLDGCLLRFSASLPGSASIDFEGRFVVANPYLKLLPPDTVVLKGQFSVQALGEPPVTFERSIVYDSGY